MIDAIFGHSFGPGLAFFVANNPPSKLTIPLSKLNLLNSNPTPGKANLRGKCQTSKRIRSYRNCPCDDARQTQSFPQRSTFSSLLLLSFFPLLPFSSSSSSLFSLNFRLLRRSCPYSVLPLAPSAPCRLPRLHVGSLDYCRLVLYNIDITAAPQAVLPLLCPPDPFTRIRARPSWTSKLGMKIPLLLSYYG
jgi:hypothetical protein